jgi:hypothetical protein
VYYVGYFMVNYTDTLSGVSQSVISLYFGSLRRLFSTFSRASYGKFSGFIVWRLTMNYLFFFLSPNLYYCDIFVALLIVNYRGFRINILKVLSNKCSRASHRGFSWCLVGCLCAYIVDTFLGVSQLFCLDFVWCISANYVRILSDFPGENPLFFELFAVQYLHKFRMMIRCKICRYLLHMNLCDW